jgi:hypothetical protein
MPLLAGVGCLAEDRIRSVTRYFRQASFAGLALIDLLITGCAHSATATAASAADTATVFRTAARSIVLCSTTESELRRKLGEPYRDGILHRRRVVSWIAQRDSPTRYLAVLLDDHGVVVDVYWDIPTEVPWVPTDQCGGQ